MEKPLTNLLLLKSLKTVIVYESYSRIKRITVFLPFIFVAYFLVFLIEN